MALGFPHGTKPLSGQSRPLSLTLAALGGQGGGVVTDWLTSVARAEKHLVQATSVPGVAQRTGATLYYLEFFPISALPPDGRRPLMALMPSPGDVDIVVATELVEAGRAVQRGLVTPNRTTLIASTHRSYTINEKSALGDGRVDSTQILHEARRSARRFIALDMAALAERNGAVISSVILGAIAGASGLPFNIESYRKAIREGGMAVDVNLKAFDAAFASVTSNHAVSMDGSSPASSDSLPGANKFSDRIRRIFPQDAWATIEHGIARMLDYQDEAYASEYLSRLQSILQLERDPARRGALVELTARGLALWMSIEDPMRVAQLKTRPNRIAEVRSHVRAAPQQVVRVREFFNPRAQEICGMLPAALGRWFLASHSRTRWLQPLTGERAICTTDLTGYVMLRLLSAARRWRRRTLRFSLEEAEIAAWLSTIREVAEQDYDLALEIAASQSLVKGYGDTYDRGLANFRKIVAVAVSLIGTADAPRKVSRLRQAALADERGDLLANELAGSVVV